MKHYAFEVTASEIPEQPVGHILIDATSKHDLWVTDDGTKLRTWTYWTPATNQWRRVTGKVIARLCRECRERNGMVAAPHGHEGDHWPKPVPRWTPDLMGVSR